MFSLESPHRGDSSEYTQYTSVTITKKITLNYPKSAAKDFFHRTQERVRNSRGKQVISVRATEVLLYQKTMKGSPGFASRSQSWQPSFAPGRVLQLTLIFLNTDSLKYFLMSIFAVRTYYLFTPYFS